MVLASRVRVIYRRVEIDWETFVSGLLPMTNQAFLLTLASETEDEYTRSISPHIKLANIAQIQI